MVLDNPLAILLVYPVQQEGDYKRMKNSLYLMAALAGAMAIQNVRLPSFHFCLSSRGYDFSRKHRKHKRGKPK